MPGTDDTRALPCTNVVSTLGLVTRGAHPRRGGAARPRAAAPATAGRRRDGTTADCLPSRWCGRHDGEEEKGALRLPRGSSGTCI